MVKILIIDDDPAILDFVQAILEDEHDVLTAKDGEKGIVICKTMPLDLIVTDIFMPFMDGLEIVREAMKICPGTKLIAMTGEDREGADSYLRLAKDMGVDGTIRKPFGADEFLNVLDAVLNAD